MSGRISASIHDDLKFVKIGVTAPDGTEFSDLGDLTELFIQESPEISFILDENVAHVRKMLPMSGIPAPESGSYSVFLLDHFGDLFCLDPSGDTYHVYSSASMISGNSSSRALTLSVVTCVPVLTAAIVTVLVLRKKKRASAAGTKA